MQVQRVLVIVGLMAGCALPLPIHKQEFVLGEVARRHDSFYPPAGDPDRDRDEAVLRPRFGLPAVVPVGTDFDIDLLERGAPAAVAAALLVPEVDDAAAARCLDGAAVEGCFPVTLGAATRTELGGGARLQHLMARPRADVGPGGYDLYLRSVVDRPTRLPRAVWLRSAEPPTHPLRVAQISDLHVGKGRTIEAHLRQVLREINALEPDLVLVTGDIIHRPSRPAQAEMAQKLLTELKAPVLVIPGNHDLGFDAGALFSRKLYAGPGWPLFARWFHSSLYYQITVDGYTFLGFDSGPSILTPRILTRGLGKSTINQLRTDLAAARQAGRRGVILFSHAASRSSLSGSVRGKGLFSQMRWGNAAFERAMLEAAVPGMPVLHLSGHTHWSDVFEVDDDRHFRRWTGTLPACPTAIRSRAALISIQSASHPGVRTKANAKGWGFVFLTLDEDHPRVSFHRFGFAAAPTCTTVTTGAVHAASP